MEGLGNTQVCDENLTYADMWTRTDESKQAQYTHHPVSSERSLYVACEYVGRVVPVVRDAGQPCVDCQQNQEELQCRPQQPSPTPCQPRLQVKLHDTKEHDVI